MLTIETIGHIDKYSVQQSALMLLSRDITGHCISKLTVRDDTYIVTTRLSINDVGAYSARPLGKTQRKLAPALPTLEHKRQLRELIRESFYRAYVAATGDAPAWGSLTGVKPASVASRLLKTHKTPSKVLTILQKQYHVSPRRADLCLQAALASREYQAMLQPNDISVYVGLPLCPARGRYCSFVSQSTQRELPLIEPYLQALYREIKQKASLIAGNKQRIVNLYIGGGTPTVLSAVQLDALLTKLACSLDLSSLREYTVEAGRPETCDDERLRILRDHGVTRVSVNPQSMHQSVLDAIGRKHSVQDVYKAVETVRKIGFSALNMDLIAGLPNDNLSGFQETLGAVQAFAPENITVHTMANKKGATANRDAPIIPQNNSHPSRMLNHTLQALPPQYHPYYLYRLKQMAENGENVGWCKRGTECGYNICIMDELHTVIGLGAGAASKIHRRHGEIIRQANPKYPVDYIHRMNV